MRFSRTLLSPPFFACALFLAFFSPLITGHSSLLYAQTDYAMVSGQIVDSSGAIVRGASVELHSILQGTSSMTVTNDAGIYVIPSIQPGPYSITVRKQGFKQVDLVDLVLNTQAHLEQNFRLEVGSVSESVTITGSATNDNPAVSMTVTREFIENMPLNGRSFQDLIQLAAGTVSSSSPGNGGGGYYVVDGQRTSSNNYTVDGVSANLGGYDNSSVVGTYGPGLSGSSPSQTALGTTQSLASIDSLQEFTIQTSGYTAEYGRNPGGQVQFTTRSGTNEIHGSLFEYLRNTVFDANSWANDYYGDPKTAEHQNDFGGTIGGPLRVSKFYNGKDKTFYFFSYEGLRLLLPAFESKYVPTQAFRDAASLNVQPFLNAAPLPNPNSPGNQDGCTVNGTPTGPACDALFSYGYSNPEKLNNISFRADQNFGKRLHAFARYADTPSSEATGAERVTTIAINTHTWTVGITANISNNLLDDLRFNYSHDGEESVDSLKPIGGAVPWTRNLLIPAAYESPYALAYASISVPSTSLSTSSEVNGSGTAQHQYQIVDSLAWITQKHSLKFGVDWRRLTPTWISDPYSSQMYIQSLAAVQQGYATTLSITAQAPGQPVLNNLSLYAQDHWKIRPRLSVDYGLRWEFNPPPGPSNGHYPVTLTSSNLVTAQLAPVGTPPFKTNYHSLAPRLGFAWNAIPTASHSLTVRGGFGIFFDAGQSMAAAAYAGDYPFSASTLTQTDVPLPLSNAAMAPPSLSFPLTPPYPYLNVSDPNLTLPYTEQWNLSVDEMLNAKNTLTISDVGNNGRKLLFTQGYQNGVPGNPDFTILYFTNNGSQSSYNGLQVQDTGRIANGLDLVAAFTWAHALDNASSDYSRYAPIYGNSNFDLRRVLNLALNYQTRIVGSSDFVHRLTRGWLLATRFASQSGYPIEITQTTIALPNGVTNQYSPDLVPGVPIYLHGSAADVNAKPVPGNWRLNRAAFACTTTGATSGACTGTPTRNGTLGRNYLRDPSFWALNTAVQRSFPVHESIRLNFRVDAFNILNHPNLGFPNATLSSSTFGQLVEGATTTIGSSNSLYAMGAARSLQFSLHLQF